MLALFSRASCVTQIRGADAFGARQLRNRRVILCARRALFIRLCSIVSRCEKVELLRKEASSFAEHFIHFLYFFLNQNFQLSALKVGFNCCSERFVKKEKFVFTIWDVVSFAVAFSPYYFFVYFDVFTGGLVCGSPTPCAHAIVATTTLTVVTFCLFSDVINQRVNYTVNRRVFPLTASFVIDY